MSAHWYNALESIARTLFEDRPPGFNQDSMRNGNRARIAHHLIIDVVVDRGQYDERLLLRSEPADPLDVHRVSARGIVRPMHLHAADRYDCRVAGLGKL